MFFYFLGFVLALVTIFGFVHTRSASEYLHLQNFCVWSSSTVRRQLQDYNIFNFENASVDDNPSMDIVEITLTRDDPSESENADTTTEVIEEIRNVIHAAEAINPSSATEEQLGACSSNTNRSEAQSSDSRDSVLSAINASLKRLSSVATSGRLNGAQLYQILLRETMLHEKSAVAADSKPRRTDDADMSDTGSTSNTVVIEPINDNDNNGNEVKAQMYFGDTPLDYTPTHRNL